MYLPIYTNLYQYLWDIVEVTFESMYNQYMSTNLETIIRNNITLSNPNKKGWCRVLCKVCNDHGRKGLRGGFIFTDKTVSYSCFNCSAKGYFHEDESTHISKEFKEVLNAFGIPDDQISQIDFEQLQKHDNTGSYQKRKQTKTFDQTITEVKLPKYFIPLQNIPDENIWKQISILYLKSQRDIEYNEYPFYLGVYDPSDPQSKRWVNRLIFPIYKDDKVIFYQGRDLTDTKPQKYLSCDTPRANVLYGYDRLTDDTNDLYIVEGFFDAYHLKGVAVFSNQMSQEQISILNRCNKRKIVIPDKKGKGYKLAQQAIKQGWYVATPDIGTSCKDMSDAVIRYGLLYVIKNISLTACTGTEAEINLSLYCEDYGQK